MLVGIWRVEVILMRSKLEIRNMLLQNRGKSIFVISNEELVEF